jgi:hypothetical protein
VGINSLLFAVLRLEARRALINGQFGFGQLSKVQAGSASGLDFGCLITNCTPSLFQTRASGPVSVPGEQDVAGYSIVANASMALT